MPAVVVHSGGQGYSPGPLVALRGDTGEVIFSAPARRPVDGARHPGHRGHRWRRRARDLRSRPATLAVHCFNNDGTLRWTFPGGGYNWGYDATPCWSMWTGTGSRRSSTDHTSSTPTARSAATVNVARALERAARSGCREVADLDLDGVPEIVAGPKVHRPGRQLAVGLDVRPVGARPPHTIYGGLDGGATEIIFDSPISAICALLDRGRQRRCGSRTPR